MSLRLLAPDRTYTHEKLVDWANGLARRAQVSGEFEWTPGLIGATSEVETTLTTTTTVQVTGLRVGMCVEVNAPSTLDAGLGVTHKCVPASDQLTIRVRNFTAGGITPASGTWLFKAYQT